MTVSGQEDPSPQTCDEMKAILQGVLNINPWPPEYFEVNQSSFTFDVSSGSTSYNLNPFTYVTAKEHLETVEYPKGPRPDGIEDPGLLSNCDPPDYGFLPNSLDSGYFLQYYNDHKDVKDFDDKYAPGCTSLDIGTAFQPKLRVSSSCPGVWTAKYRICHVDESKCSGGTTFTYVNCASEHYMSSNPIGPLESLYGNAGTAGDPYPVITTATIPQSTFKVGVNHNGLIGQHCGNLVWTYTISPPVSHGHVTFDSNAGTFIFDMANRDTTLPAEQTITLYAKAHQANYPDKILEHTYYVKEFRCRKTGYSLTAIDGGSALPDDPYPLSVELPVFYFSGYRFKITGVNYPQYCPIGYLVTINDPAGVPFENTVIPSTSAITPTSGSNSATKAFHFQLSISSSSEEVQALTGIDRLTNPDLNGFTGVYQFVITPAFNGIPDVDPTESFSFSFEIKDGCDTGNMLKIVQPSLITDDSTGLTMTTMIVDISDVPPFTLSLTMTNNPSLVDFVDGNFAGVGYFLTLCGDITIDVNSVDQGFWSYDDSVRKVSFTSTGWPAVPEATHTITIDYTVDAKYNHHLLALTDPILTKQSSSFDIYSMDCSVLFDAPQDIPFIVYQNYEMAKTLTLAYHDNIPSECLSIALQIPTINTSPIASFSFFTDSLDLTPPQIPFSSSAGDLFTTSVYTGAIEKVFMGVPSQVLNFESKICQIHEPSTIYKSGLDELNFVDISNLPSPTEKIIELSPYSINDDTCGWLMFELELVSHTGDPAFDLSNVSYIADKDNGVLNLKFANLETYTPGVITIKLKVDSDTYDHSLFAAAFEVDIPLHVVDCLDEGTRMTINGNAAYSVPKEMRFGTTTFSQTFDFTSVVYTFDTLFSQDFCAIESWRVTCEDPNTSSYIVRDSTVESSASVLCAKFAFNQLSNSLGAPLAVTHSLSSDQANFPSVLEATDPADLDQRAFEGQYTITVSPVHPLGQSYTDGTWSFNINMYIDCWLVVLSDPGVQNFDITPPVFYNNAVTFADTTMHYWLRSVRRFPVTGFVNEYSFSCEFELFLTESGQPNLNQITINEFWSVWITPGVNLISLDQSTIEAPFISVSSDRNVGDSFLSPLDLVIQGSILCTSGMEGCTVGDLLQAAPGTLTVISQFVFYPRTDCSNEAQDPILWFNEDTENVTIDIGLTVADGKRWQEDIKILFPKPDFKDQTHSDQANIFIHSFAADTNVDGRPNVCVQGWQMVLETDAQVQSDLFSTINPSAPQHEFTVISTINNNHVVNLAGCNLALYEVDQTCDIEYKVQIKVDLTNINGDVTSTTIATQASGTITYISECQSLDTQLPKFAGSYWQLSSANVKEFDRPLVYGYEVSYLNIEAQFDLPYVQPVLATGQDLITTCGPIVYNIVPQFDMTSKDAFTMAVADTSVYESAVVKVQTTDVTYALEDAGYATPYESFYEWEITATMDFHLFAGMHSFDFQASVVYQPIVLKMYDHCYGMTITGGPPSVFQMTDKSKRLTFNITENVHYDTSSENVEDWTEVPRDWTYSMRRHILYGQSSFTTSELRYVRPFSGPFDPDLPRYEIGEGCGPLRYTITYTSWDWNNYFLLVQPIATFHQPDGTKLWEIYGEKRFQLGNHEIKVTVDAEEVLIASPRTMTFDYEVLDCFVDNFFSPEQGFEDLDIQLANRVMDFRNFTQVPACAYPANYTVIMVETTYGSLVRARYKAGMTLPDDLVTLQDGFLSITPKGSHQGKTWTVYIEAILITNTTIQEYKYARSRPFQLTVQQPSFSLENTAPGIDRFVALLRVYAGVSRDYRIGFPYDSQLDDFYLEKWRFEGVPEDLAPAWITLNEKQDITKGIYVSVSPSMEDIDYSVRIEFTLTDLNPNPKSKTFSFVITVLAPEEDFLPYQPDETKREPTKEIISVWVDAPDTDGFFFITFSKFISVRRNCTEWTEANEGDSRIHIDYLPANITQDYMYDLDLQVKMSWSVVYATVEYEDEPYYSKRHDPKNKSATENAERRLSSANVTVTEDDDTDFDEDFVFRTNKLRMKLDFTWPQIVSKSIQDSLKVAVNETLFVEEFPDQEVTFIQENLYDYKFSFKIPIQGQKEVNNLTELIAQVTDITLKAFLGSSFILSFVLSHILQYLWAMIHGLQIMVLMALFRLEIPYNASFIMTTILNLCGLEFISTEGTIEYLFNFRETQAMLTEIGSDGEEISKWADSGFDSSNFIQLLGALFFIPILFGLALLAKRLLTRITACCSDNWLTRRIRKHIDVRIIIVRFLLEGCIELGLCAMISIVMVDREVMDNGWEVFSFTLSCLCIIVLIATPIYVKKIIKTHLQVVDTSDIKDRDLAARESPFYEVLAYYKATLRALNYAIYFLLRRYWIVLVLTVMPALKYSQILSQILSSGVIISYVGAVRPFISTLTNRQEVANEIFVLIASYPLFTFTPWVWDYERQTDMGWFLVGTILVNIIFNIVLISYVIVKQLIFKARVAYARYRRKKLALEWATKKAEAEKQANDELQANRDNIYKMFHESNQSAHKVYDTKTQVVLKLKQGDQHQQPTQMQEEGGDRKIELKSKQLPVVKEESKENQLLSISSNIDDPYLFKGVMDDVNDGPAEASNDDFDVIGNGQKIPTRTNMITTGDVVNTGTMQASSLGKKVLRPLGTDQASQAWASPLTNLEEQRKILMATKSTKKVTHTKKESVQKYDGKSIRQHDTVQQNSDTLIKLKPGQLLTQDDIDFAEKCKKELEAEKLKEEKERKRQRKYDRMTDEQKFAQGLREFRRHMKKLGVNQKQ